MTATTTTEKGSETPEGVRVSEPATPVVEEDTPGAEAVGEDVDAPGVSPESYAETFGLALNVEDLGRARSAQTDGGVLGASDAGTCERKAVWTVTQQTPTDVPKKGRAQVGTYLHEGTLKAVGALYPHRLIEQELTVTLPSGIKVPLHPDEIDPEEPSVTDYKFTAEVAVVRKTGPTDEQQMQRAMQYLAAHQAGLVPPEGTVRNLWVSMTDLDDRFVQQEPFSMEWIHRADDFYQRVIYAVKNLEDGEPQWPWNLCKDYCPFFRRCRPPQPELNQPIANPDLAELVLLGYQAREERKNWQKIEEHVVSEIKGLSGRVGDVQVITTTVNGAQRSYQKVEWRKDKS